VWSVRRSLARVRSPATAAVSRATCSIERPVSQSAPCVRRAGQGDAQ
jgi:hypothetical protein